jgi:hypothetical protein
MRPLFVSLIVLVVLSSVAMSSQADAPRACSIVGDWNGVYPPGPYPFSGTPITMSFRADNTGETKSSRATSPIVWRMDGANLSMHGTQSGTTPYSCKREDEGKYSLTFSADCSTVKLGLVSDPCVGRGTTANNMSLTRK